MKGRVLTGLATVVVAYAVSVVWFVSTMPDLGIRCLLIDDAPQADSIEVCSGAGATRRGFPPIREGSNNVIPAAGDRLISIAGRPIRTFIDFTRSLNRLRNAPIPPGGKLNGTDPLQKPP